MKVGHEIETKRASWSFDGSVADTFVDHVRQSVPLYDAGHERTVVRVLGHLATGTIRWALLPPEPTETLPRPA